MGKKFVRKNLIELSKTISKGQAKNQNVVLKNNCLISSIVLFRFYLELLFNLEPMFSQAPETFPCHVLQFQSNK